MTLFDRVGLELQEVEFKADRIVGLEPVGGHPPSALAAFLVERGGQPQPPPCGKPIHDPDPAVAPAHRQPIDAPGRAEAQVGRECALRHVSGHSLLAAPPKEGSTVYFEALSANLNRGWAPLRGVIRDDYKLIVLPLPELYHLPSDRREENNLVTKERALARQLLAELPRESTWPPSREEGVSEETAERLKSLGYLSGTATRPERYTDEDDPKSLIDLDRMMHMAVDSYSRGEYQEAIDIARVMVKRRPSMRLGQSLLAPDRVDEALAVLRPLAAKDNVTSVNTLALALSEGGRHDEAFATFSRALELDPDSGKAHEGIALVELRRGRWGAARDAARKALERSERLELAWNNLGVALHRLSDTDGAIAAWQRAVELRPELFDALYNLGTTALDAGRPEIAYQALSQFVAEAPAERYAADLRRARVLVNRLLRARKD